MRGRRVVLLCGVVFGGWCEVFCVWCLRALCVVRGVLCVALCALCVVVLLCCCLCCDMVVLLNCRVDVLLLFGCDVALVSCRVVVLSC